jgi:glycosyltransferase involved in cell wall biosynthesis
VKHKVEKCLSIVVPVYKEQDNILPFLTRLEPVISGICQSYEVIFVLDPSPDETESRITTASSINPQIKMVKMSRRFGQPAATMAGLTFSQGEKVVVIDVDLQDPPELILELDSKFREGFDVVYATRRRRDGESLLKKTFAFLGYRMINKLSDVQIPTNTGDFRMMSRRVVDEICALNEKHGFLRGLVAYVGFNQTAVYYDRDARYSGTGNYNRFVGSLKIGLNGLIGFSAKPLNLMAITGGVIAGFSFLIGSWYAFQKVVGVSITPGLSTTVILVSFFAGIQLLSLGLVGEYISRIYDEVKNRPMYIVEKRVGFDD